ncbi:MAG: DUF3575 domain-containing protein [Bacteroidales bacterium]|nr:DUF3575 domain-containing protein [Bacteroidales bacterium]
MCERTIFKSAAACISKRILLLLSSLLIGGAIYAQRLSVATNLVGYANFGTINGEIGLGLSKHFSIYMQGKYNPFTYKENSPSQFQNRQASVSIGGRYWLWHIWSGWFVMGQAGYSRYNRGGLAASDTFEGDAYGITLGAGYALMLHKHFNIDFGAGLMGGFADYTKYSCPKCGVIEEKGRKIFVAPNNILVQLSYLF